MRRLRPSIQNGLIGLTLFCAIMLSGCNLMTLANVIITIILLITMVMNVILLSVYGRQDNE